MEAKELGWPFPFNWASLTGILAVPGMGNRGIVCTEIPCFFGTTWASDYGSLPF